MPAFRHKLKSWNDFEISDVLSTALDWLWHDLGINLSYQWSDIHRPTVWQEFTCPYNDLEITLNFKQDTTVLDNGLTMDSPVENIVEVILIEDFVEVSSVPGNPHHRIVLLQPVFPHIFCKTSFQKPVKVIVTLMIITPHQFQLVIFCLHINIDDNLELYLFLHINVIWINFSWLLYGVPVTRWFVQCLVSTPCV